MDSKQRLTKQEIADLSGLSIGKVKYYIRQFPAYFEEHLIGGDRHPVYNAESVEIAKLIADLIRDNNYEDIERELKQAGFNPIIDHIEDDDIDTTATIDDNRAIITRQLLSGEKWLDSAVDAIASLNQLNDLQAEIIRKQSRVISEQSEQIADLEEENERLKRQMDDSSTSS